jgi:hypothetical protein
MVPGERSACLGFDRFLLFRDRTNVGMYHPTSLRPITGLMPHFSGNAKVAGMSTDLDLVGLKYNIAAAVFFVWLFLLSFLKHAQRSLRSHTVLQKSLRKSKQHILIL